MQNIKFIIAAFLLIAITWLFTNWQFQKEENARQTENVSQLRKSDSLRFTTQNLNTQEIQEYLEYQNSSLKNKLEKEAIKLNRIESIVSQKYSYIDKNEKETDISEIVDAIKNSVPKSENWTDSSKCLIVKGSVTFDGQKLKVLVSDREFKNKSDAVAYWQRREWNFLGLKTRFLGKKEFTAKQYDDCGESQVMKIEKKK